MALKGAVLHGAFNWQYSFNTWHLHQSCLHCRSWTHRPRHRHCQSPIPLQRRACHLLSHPKHLKIYATGLERLYYHFCQDFSPGFIHPSKDKVSRQRLLLSVWSVHKQPANLIQAKCFFQTLSSNGLFKHLSRGCNTGVRLPGMTATSIFRCLWATLTSSLKWAQKESHTKGDCLWKRVVGKHWRIHSFTPDLSTHPFLWKETQREFGTTRYLGVRTPLKTTFGGSLVPSAAMARMTVKLHFSALQVLTGTVRLLVNLRERNEGSSKRCDLIELSKVLSSVEN